MSTTDLFRLDGKTALVTGCSRGTGFAMATALARAGADIVGVSRSLESVGSEIRNAVEAAGREFRDYSVDFSKRTEVYRLFDRLMKDSPVIDVLVNNAGHIMRRPAAEEPDERWDEILDTSRSSQVMLIREIGKNMVERRSGKIIFTTSLLPSQGGITVPGYAASMGAIGQLTKALASEWAPYNVQVNALAPRYIGTDSAAASRMDPAGNSSATAQLPVGCWGTREDLEGVTVFLASSASDCLSGHIIMVDGEWMGWRKAPECAACADDGSTSSAGAGANRHHPTCARYGT